MNSTVDLFKTVGAIFATMFAVGLFIEIIKKVKIRGDKVDVRNSSMPKSKARELLDTAYRDIVKFDQRASNNAFNETTFVNNSKKVLEIAQKLDSVMEENNVKYLLNPTIKYFVDEAKTIVKDYEREKAEERAEHLYKSFDEAYGRFEDWEGCYEILRGRVSYHKSLVFQRYEKYTSYVNSEGISNQADTLLSLSCISFLKEELHGKKALIALISYYEEKFRQSVNSEKSILDKRVNKTRKKQTKYKTKASISRSYANAGYDYGYDYMGLIKYLREVKIRFVDKTKSGGCLWIEDSPKSNDIVRRITINGVKPVRAAKTRNFNGKSGWYFPADRSNPPLRAQEAGNANRDPFGASSP